MTLFRQIHILRMMHIVGLWLFWVMVILILLSGIMVTQAAEQERSISLQVIAKEHIQLNGSALENTLTEIKLADMQQKKRINLGTLGIETGTQANCYVHFSSANNYRLQQVGKKNNYLAAYQLKYKGKLVNKPTQLAMSCNEGNALLMLIPTQKITAAMLESMAKNVYQDKLRVVVTTP